MSWIITEAGANAITPLLEMASRITSTENMRIGLLDQYAETSFEYKPWNDGWPALKQFSKAEKIVSILIHIERDNNFRLLIFRPHYLNSQSPYWTSIVDGGGTLNLLRFEELQRIDGLQYLSMSVEESLDLGELSEINRATFPWQHWRLIKAVVAEPGEELQHLQATIGPMFSKISLG